MIRLLYRLYRLTTWVRYSVPRHLTPAGQLMLIGLILAGSASVDMDRTIAYQAFALQLCLLVTALFFKWRFSGRFEVERQLPRYATAGQAFRYRILVRNRSRRAWAGLAVFEDLEDPRPNRAEFARWLNPEAKPKPFQLKRNSGTKRVGFHRAATRPVALPTAASGETVTVAAEIQPLRRGALRFVAVSIARPDPLGLSRAFRRIPQPATVMVLPRRYPVPALALAGTRQYQPGGVTLAATVGESEEFISLRDYRPGDPLRHIHWRSWARLARPIVREFQDEFVPRHALVLDTFARASQAEAFEEAVSVAASFACTVETQESLLDLLFVGPEAICFTTGRGLGQTERALETLAAVRRNEQASFTSLEQLVRRHAPLVCDCICVFVAWDESRQNLVRQLQALGKPVMTLIIGKPSTTKDSQADRLTAAGAGLPNVHYLEPGRIAEGLSRLEGHR